MLQIRSLPTLVLLLSIALLSCLFLSLVHPVLRSRTRRCIEDPRPPGRRRYAGRLTLHHVLRVWGVRERGGKLHVEGRHRIG